MMKKIKMLFVVSLVPTVLAGLAFVNNVAAVANWWRAFLAAGGDSAGVNAHAPGCFAWLDWSAVDYSAVTTLIPFLGFLCITVSLARLLRGRRMRPDDFPFFRGSDQLNVALGLFGTLWGIIVIGYFKLDTVGMADLMQCLHTALFSTLMAVVWVFMIDRPLLRPYFARILESSGLAESDESDLAGAVDRLVVRLGEASDAFDRRQREFEAAFEQRQAAYAADFEKRRGEYEKAFEQRQATYAADFENQRKDLAAATEQLVKRLGEASDAFDRRQREFEAAFEKRQGAYEAAAEQRQSANEAAFKQRQEAYAADFEKRRGDYQAEFEKRQREYTDFFTRRIAELEKRAEQSEAKLKAVVEALHA